MNRLSLEKNFSESKNNNQPEKNPIKIIHPPNLVTWMDELSPLISEGIVLIDTLDRIYYFSCGAERLSGWSQEEIYGKSIFELFDFKENLSQVFTDPPRPIQNNRAEIFHREGYPIPIKFCFSRPPDQRPEYASSMLIIQDAREEDAVNKLRAFFLANITHEFRTPLSSLNASVEFLLEEIEYLSRNEIQTLLTSVHLSVTGLQTLIDNLLESIQIEAGRFSISPRKSDLEKILSEANRVMSPIITRRQQILKMNIPETAPSVLCDPTRVTQVLVNLLSNASKFGPTQQEIQLNVELSGDQWIKISVTDHGPGIPINERGKIFGRYYRLDRKSNPQDGIGLGLWVVHVIVEQHGGVVGVEEAPAGGSIFWFTIPIAK